MERGCGGVDAGVDADLFPLKDAIESVSVAVDSQRQRLFMLWYRRTRLPCYLFDVSSRLQQLKHIAIGLVDGGRPR